MNLFLKNIFKKHTDVWKNSIFSAQRFVYQNTDNNTLPEDEGIAPTGGPQQPDAKEKKGQAEQKQKQENDRKQFEIDTSKITEIVRKTAAQALGKKQKETVAKSFLESGEFINEVAKSIKEKYLHQIKSVQKALEDAQGELEIRMSYADAMKQIGMTFGIPSTVQKAIMSEFETGTDVKNHVKNFEKFLEKVMNAFSENIKQFINFDQLITENPKLFSQKVEGSEKKNDTLPKRIAQRIEKALKEKEKEDTIAFEEKLQETIKTVIEPIVDKACDMFGVEEDEMLRKGFKKNSVQRAYLLTEYGNYKEADWYLQTSTNASQKEKEDLEKRKQDAKENIQIQKQRAKIQVAIQVYNLNHADLGGGQSLGERLMKNQDLIEHSMAEIKKTERVIEDNEQTVKNSRNETEKTKARNEIISMQNKIETEKKEIELLRSEIDWTLGEYKTEDQNKDEAEKAKRKEDVVSKTREQATMYLINTAGWLNEERYGENTMFGKEDIPLLRKMLLGERDETTGKDYLGAISTNQLLTFCEMHKRGNDSFDEFIDIVKNCGEVIKELTEQNLERDSFYANFLRDKFEGELPTDAKSISSEQLRTFFDGLFSLSQSQSEDEGKKTKMKELKNIVLGYMGGDPKKENKLYYRPDEMNEFGKKETRVTMGQKGREMMYDMLSAFTNNKFNAAADIEKIISENWNEGLYPCILKYDENARKIEGKHAKEKGKKPEGGGEMGFWDNPFEKVFGQWRLLNFYMVAEIFTTGFEGIKRNFQLKNARKAAEAGYDLADYIPGWGKILKAEFLSVKQAKENEEVNKYKSSFEQYGYMDIVEQIHNAPNSFVIKAALITLAEKGYLARNDIMDRRSIRSINKHLGTQLGIKIIVPDGDPNDWPSEEKTKIMNQLRTVIDPFWGQGILDGWFSQSDSARENNVQKNFSISQKLTSAEKERNFSELISLLLKDSDEFKRRYPIDVVLGYIRQDIVEGKIDCDYHLTVLSILVWKGILEDNHVEEFRMKHANDYPSYVILNKGQMRHSGLGDFCERAIQSGELLKNGLLNDNHWYMKFFINRQKLPLRVIEADPDGEGTYWKIAETEEEALSPQYKVRDVLASNLHKRAAHLQNVDNSNAQVYYRAYDVEELKSNVLRIGTNGKLEKITRGHDLTAALAGFFSSMYSDLDAVRATAEGKSAFGEGVEGTYENFMTQAKTAFFDLKNTYTLIEHITQHETRMMPKEDNVYGIPKPGEPQEKERSYVRDTANLYYQNIKGARVNRLVSPPVLGVANDFAKNNAFNGEQIKRAINDMMGLDYMKFNQADKKMLGFKPWEHFWEAANKFDAYFAHLAEKRGWKYNPDEAKSFIKGSTKPTGEKIAA